MGVLVRSARRVLVVAGMGGVVYVAYALGRAAAATVAVAGCLAVFGAVAIWLPRAAHNAFVRGDAARAALWYHALRWSVPDRRARDAVRVSLVACALVRGEGVAALHGLDTIDPGGLCEAARAAWFNNRAYALARGEADPAEALACSDRAIALRPRVAGFRHTRGLALLGLGRLDDAVRELDAVWTVLDGADAPPVLESERCFDLGMAWRRKGEIEYACDYFQRAMRAAPESVWGQRAARECGESAVGRGQEVLPDLV